jgi:SPP1 family predicted phage head-tail adaptor
VKAGSLKRRITIQKRPVNQTASGGIAENWANVGTFWASIKALPTKKPEPFKAEQFTSEVTHDVRVRYSSLSKVITPAMRIKFGSRYFDIQAVVIIEEENRELQLIALERR